MASNLDNSARSERHSIVYDDVASQANLSIDSITAPEDAQEKIDAGALVKEDECAKASGQKVTKESNKIGIHGQNELKNVDGEKGAERKDGSNELISKGRVDKNDYNYSESQRDKRTIGKDSNKELWTPVKRSDSKESIESTNSDDKETGEIVGENSSDDHPKKPPRRHPPKRRLPQPPQSTSSTSKPGRTERSELESSTSDDGLPMEQKPAEIVCKPVLTSSPNQHEIPNLSVETVDKIDTSRKVLSFLDESQEGGTRRVESFYDFLYSQGDTKSAVEETSPIIISEEGDRIGSALSDSDDHLYDSVPVEDSVAESFSRKSGFESYDEVIVNQGMDLFKLNSSTIDEVGGWCSKGCGSVSLGPECHGIYGNPVSGTHPLRLHTEGKFSGDKY